MVQKLRRFLLILVKDFPTFGDLGNCNLTWESPQISTRWSQTPDEGIGTLSAKCATQEVFDDSHLSGNIEGSQTDVYDGLKIFPQRIADLMNQLITDVFVEQPRLHRVC